MASPLSPVTPDTLITIKIHHLDDTKRVKLPLRDLSPATLEDKLRGLLGITSSSGYRFERYSDSAGVFVTLDRNNPPVYRQLYRAAKAKQKLKIRVVAALSGTVPTDQSRKTTPSSKDNVPAKTAKPNGPRPVTLEDVSEPTTTESAPLTTTQSSAESSASKPARPATMPVVVSSNMSRQDYPIIPGCFPLIQTPLVPVASASASASASSYWAKERSLLSTLESVARSHDEMERNISCLTLSVAEMSRKAQSINGMPLSHSSGTDAKPASAPKEASSANPTTTEATCEPSLTADASKMLSGHIVTDSPVFPTTFSIRCNSCDRKIPDEHYHCSTCEAGDFDLCGNCVALGISCYNSDHWLITRSIKNGVIINSTTERILPKPKAATEQTPAKKETGSVSQGVSTSYQPPYSLSCMYGVQPLSRAASLSESCCASAAAAQDTAPKPSPRIMTRTCNNCITELPEDSFLHCKVCFDFDLCKDCFVSDKHGHHPAHAFEPAVDGIEFGGFVTHRLAAGRGQIHNAVCDGCDTYITGIRHKCLECPDWDFCAECFVNVELLHPGHRFVPISEPLKDISSTNSVPVVHSGIYCDGPLCVSASRYCSPIMGIRYKCTVCNNKDFCANCEASPSNSHNKTHPLIKFRTPVRHVAVTTTSEHENGTNVRLGDVRPRTYTTIHPPSPATTTKTGAQTTKDDESDPLVSAFVRRFKALETLDETNAPVENVPVLMGSVPAAVQKVREPFLDLQATIDMITAAAESTVASATAGTKPTVEDMPVAKVKTLTTNDTHAEPDAAQLGATFQSEAISDGTVFPPNNVFEQTWVLRNTGTVAWPAGCCVRFVSGDYMGHVDRNHPAGISELVSASESTICYESLAPGAEFPFTVLLRTPPRLGKTISYWRLSTKGGIKFGDRLWCQVDVRVKQNENKDSSKAEPEIEKPEGKKEEETSVSADGEESTETSQMIFPKLEKESPVTSVHEPESFREHTDIDQEAASQGNQASAVHEQFEDDEWDEDSFLTDEEYDVLDASDEEFFDDQLAKDQKK